MITAIKEYALRHWQRWIKQRQSAGDPQLLGPRNIYILPSSFGWAYGFVVFTLLISAINYQISGVFLMTFLLAVIGLISAWEAQTNLKDLALKFISLEDAQQGIPAQLILFIYPSKNSRYGLEFKLGKQAKTRLEKIPAEGLQFTIPITTNSRGYFSLPQITISSYFPFGIFQVWSYARFDAHYYVYPQPLSPEFWPQPIAEENQKSTQSEGNDEFYELKQVVNPWVDPHRIAWKIAAKGQGWYLKTMNSTEGHYWLFRLEDLPNENLELALQYLSYWLLTAEQRGYFYRLELNKSMGQFSQGKDHLRHSLRQLALYQ